MQQQWAISQWDCDMQQKVDFIWQPAVTSSVVRLRRSSKALPKVKLAPKNRSWSLFGCLLLVLSTTPFWIPAKPFHLRSMLSKSMRCTENRKACSQHWSTERAQFFSTTMPDCTSHNQRFKSWTNGATKFCLICHTHLTSHPPTTTPSSISQLFAGKMRPQPAGGRKCFQEFMKPRGMDFYITGINKLLSRQQKYVDCSGSCCD